MNRYSSLIGLLALLALLTGAMGCATATRAPVPEVTSASLTVVAADFCGQLQRRFVAAGTVFCVDRKASDPVFATALERTLRAAGYALTNEPKAPGATTVVATLTAFDENHVQAVVDGVGTLQMARLYERGEEGVYVAASAFTCREDKLTPSTRATARTALPPATKPPVHRFVAQPRQQAPIQGEVPRQNSAPYGNAGPRDQTNGEKKVAAVVPSAAAPDTGAIAHADGAAADKIGEDAIEVSPDRDGVVELSPAIARRRDGATPNPFVQEYRPKEGGRELSFAISGVVLGPTPTVVINGHVYSVGESVEGFSVAAIQAGVVRLRSDPFLLRLSVSNHPVVVKCL